MRLEVTLSGEYYRVCAQKLTKGLAEAMREKYAKNWRQVLNRLAVGPQRKQSLADVAEKTGQVPSLEYQCEGVLLSSPTLSLAIRHNGMEVFAEQVDQTVRKVLPAKFMDRFKPDDVLGVFAITGGGFIRCEFEPVKTFDGGLLKLDCDDVRTLINRREGFELVQAMTYNGEPPTKIECAPAAQMEHLKQVFHAKRR